MKNSTTTSKRSRRKKNRIENIHVNKIRWHNGIFIAQNFAHKIPRFVQHRKCWAAPKSESNSGRYILPSLFPWRIIKETFSLLFCTELRAIMNYNRSTANMYGWVHIACKRQNQTFATYFFLYKLGHYFENVQIIAEIVRIVSLHLFEISIDFRWFPSHIELELSLQECYFIEHRHCGLFWKKWFYIDS